mmetsp:Transcript_40040/g.128434  ORF Transcript_40040/g.128434 Transcript_40040/m.128434 type:complete len:217 (-) Transcript_40040:13-663(-)
MAPRPGSTRSNTMGMLKAPQQQQQRRTPGRPASLGRGGGGGGNSTRPGLKPATPPSRGAVAEREDRRLLEENAQARARLQALLGNPSAASLAATLEETILPADFEPRQPPALGALGVVAPRAEAASTRTALSPDRAADAPWAALRRHFATLGLVATFAAFDADRDGFVTPEEFRSALAVAAPPITQEDVVRNLWELADPEGIGDLSLGQLSALLAL